MIHTYYNSRILCGRDKLLFGAVFMFFVLKIVAPIEIAYAGDARLYLSPITGTYAVNSPTAIRVSIFSPDTPIKAIEGKITYNPKEVTVLAVSKDTSVLSSWTTPPQFDNTKGEIAFGGWMASSTVLDHREIFSLLVSPERVGEFRITFESGAAILSADGSGGNVISEFTSGIYGAIPKDTTDILVTPPGEGEYDALVSGEVLGASTASTSLSITSTTHPDQNAWYGGNTSSLAWTLPANSSNVRLAIDHKQGGKGRILYAPPITQKQLTDLDDGVWYFHLTAVSDAGEEKTNHYRVGVDSTAPENLHGEVMPGVESTNPNISLLLTATDTVSGIDHFGVSIDKGAEIFLKENPSSRYEVNVGNPGPHTLLLSAYDRAGNKSEFPMSITVDYLLAPTVALSRTDIIEGDSLSLKVSTLPNTTATISYAHPGDAPKSEELFIDASGEGRFSSKERMSIGTYEVTVHTRDQSGGVSKESVPLFVMVGASVGGIMSRHPFVPITFLAFTLLLLFSWIAWRKMNRREEVTAEVYGEAEPELAYEYAEVPYENYDDETSGDNGVVVLRQKESLQLFEPIRL